MSNDINITIEVISTVPADKPVENVQFIDKEFTETAILYSMTGHIFISGTASDEYVARALSEVKSDAVYTYVMSSVPVSLQQSLWEMYDVYSKDVDPILYKYLCAQLPSLKKEVDVISKLLVSEATEYLEKKCLSNTTYVLKPITFEEWTLFADEVHQEEEEKAHSSAQL